MAIYLGFFAVGIAILVFAISIEQRGKKNITQPISVNKPFPTGSVYLDTTIFVLCLLSGMIFILLLAFWCCAIFMIRGIDMHSICDCCTKSDLDNNRNYGSLTCAFWITTILFVSIATALATNTLGGGLQVFDSVCQSANLQTFDFLCLETVVMIFMWTLIGLFVCCNALCYFVCIRHLAGQICGKSSNNSQA